MKIILVFFLFFITAAFGQTPAKDPHWQLLWQDNFSTYFDATKWVKADNCDFDGKPQLFTADNVSIYAGKLRFDLLEEYAECNGTPTTYVCGGCVYPDHLFTSGWVNSTEEYKMEYGYIESRILFPYGNGLWTAFWLWSHDSRNEEIDIVELYPGMLEEGDNIYYGQRHNEDMNTSHLHYEVTSGSGWTPVQQDYIYPIDNYHDWHTYACEWSPNKIIIYVDGVVVNNIQNPQIGDPKYIILGVGMLPDADIIPPRTGIPATKLVDYVRVYNLDSDCSNAIWTCNYDFSNHDYKVKRVISIGGSGCSNSLTSGQNITLRAKEYVIINGDFTVPVGAELYIDCNNPCY